MRFDFTYSLQGRFIILALLMCALVISVVYIAYENITTTSQKTIDNLENRNKIETKVETIKTHVFLAYQNINAFLLDPTRVNLKKVSGENIKIAEKISQTLKLEKTLANNPISTHLEDLTSDLQALENGRKFLIETRFDNNKLFPSMYIGSTIMHSSRMDFENAILVTLTEFEEDQLDNNQDNEVYKTLFQTQYIWSQIISYFRIYLANRFGSFDETFIPVQESSILELHDILTIQFNMIEMYIKQDRLGFQAEDALTTLRLSAVNWFNGYNEIRALHHSGKWRTDTIYIRSNLEPLLTNIADILARINNDLHNSDERETLNLATVAETQIRVMWLLALFCFAFLAVVLIFVERLVFKPINHISNKMKADAMGIAQIALPKLFTKETKQLIDSFTEMREQVQHRQFELEHQAMHDALTGLPNRIFLQDRLDQAIRNAHRDKQFFSLFIIDLDRFKEINDTLGHHIGDQLLVKVGLKLNSILRETDTVARLGGDEFAVLLPRTDLESAIRMAKLISRKLEVPISLDNHRLQARASIGIAVYPIHGEKDTILMQRADVAMYSAKKQKSSFAVYHPRRDDNSANRFALMNDLNSALDKNLLVLRYQPAFSIETRRITSLECLVRWQHPEYGDIPASELIAMAEQTTMINSITYWVFETAFKQYAIWRRSNVDFKISINMSVTNLQEQNFLQHLESHLTYYNIPPEKVVLEITEYAMMANPGRVLKTLSFINELGVNLSIDDYGTGFSSLSYLKQLPVSELKIDKSFITNLPNDKNDVFIVKSTIEMAHNLGLKVVAEGVETQAALQCLKELNCDTVQGYYFSRPLPTNEATKLLQLRDPKDFKEVTS